MNPFASSNLNIQKQVQQYMDLQERQKPKIETATSDEPIVGLRVWKIAMVGGMPKLKSVYKSDLWPYRKALERDCLNDMGIHAVKSGIHQGSTDVLALFRDYQADIAGEVYLWGKVEEHRFGYLADFAYPKRLFPHKDLDPIIAMQLEDEYGVTCEYREEFDKSVVRHQLRLIQQMQNAMQAQQNAMGNWGMLGGASSNPFGSSY